MMAGMVPFALPDRIAAYWKIIQTFQMSHERDRTEMTDQMENTENGSFSLKTSETQK